MLLMMMMMMMMMMIESTSSDSYIRWRLPLHIAHNLLNISKYCFKVQRKALELRNETNSCQVQLLGFNLESRGECRYPSKQNEEIRGVSVGKQQGLTGPGMSRYVQVLVLIPVSDQMNF